MDKTIKKTKQTHKKVIKAKRNLEELGSNKSNYIIQIDFIYGHNIIQQAKFTVNINFA